MCGMRAGMRCAQLREGAGGSGGPATGPSGRRRDAGGRGPCGRDRAGEGPRARTPSSPDLSACIRLQPLPRAHTFPEVRRRDASPPQAPLPAPPGGVSDPLPGAENLPLSARGGALEGDWARAPRPATVRISGCGPASLPACPRKAGGAGRAAPSPRLPPRDIRSEEPRSRDAGS